MKISGNEKQLFEKALAIVLDFEGYKTEDTGGRTVYGISENAHPVEVEKMWDLPAEEALEIAKEVYFEEYWKKMLKKYPWPDSFNRMINRLDFKAFIVCYFDTAVNLGVSRAHEIYLQAMIQCNRVIDRMTEFILWARVEHYCELAKNDKYKPYLRGWLNRVIKLRKKVR